MCCLKNNCTYYVPITDNIRNWLSNERIQNMVLSAPKCNCDGFLVDCCSGDIFRQYTLLQNGNTIPIIQYQSFCTMMIQMYAIQLEQQPQYVILECSIFHLGILN